MARDALAIGERIFSTFLAPLVLGGTLVPGKPVGGKHALVLREGMVPADTKLASRVALARVRVARRLVPIDTLPPAPTGDEWMLASILHDVVQSTHPGFDAVFRRSGPAQILRVASRTLEHVVGPSNARDALSRHTWFSRMFAITRTDVDVHWWTGHRTFLGEDPPARLVAWPEARRVQQIPTKRPFMDLPLQNAPFDVEAFTEVVRSFLGKSPLTDLATATRPGPVFAWTTPALGLAATAAGRTLALRALALLPSDDVDRVLGRATRALAGRPDATAIATTLLRDRALRTAERKLAGAAPTAFVTHHDEDAAFARSAGTSEALRWLSQPREGFSESERAALTKLLEARARDERAPATPNAISAPAGS